MKSKNNPFGVSDEIIKDFNRHDARGAASDEANEQIRCAYDMVDALLFRIGEDDGESIVKNHPNLLGVHALLATLEFYGDRIAHAVEKISESLDFIAAKPAPSDVPNENEKMVIYRALEARYLNCTASRRSGPTDTASNTKDLEAAQSRFKRIAGL